MKTLLIISAVLHFAKFETSIYSPNYSQNINSRTMQIPFHHSHGFHEIDDKVSARSENVPRYRPEEYYQMRNDPVRISQNVPLYQSEEYKPRSIEMYIRPEDVNSRNLDDHMRRTKINRHLEEVPLYQSNENSRREESIISESSYQNDNHPYSKDTTQTRTKHMDSHRTENSRDRVGFVPAQEESYTMKIIIAREEGKPSSRNVEYSQNEGRISSKSESSERRHLFYPEDHRQESNSHDRTTENSGFSYPEETKKEEENQVDNNKSNAPIQAPDKCPEDQLLYPGDHETCDCGAGHIYYSPKDRCYPAYRRGPCKSGQYLVYNKRKHQTECIKNTCSDGSVRYRGKCYELESSDGPCPPVSEGGGVFGVNVTTLEVGCLVGHEGLTLFKFPSNCPPGSKRDVGNKCRENYNV